MIVFDDLNIMLLDRSYVMTLKISSWKDYNDLRK